MREIKFRAWDGERLRKVNTIGWVDEGVDFVTTPRYSGPAEDFRLMQYTGSKDKNDVEIYERDIVKRTHLFNGGYGETHTGEVVYDKECARYVISRPKKHIEPKTEDLRNTLSDKSTYEVIGNIYENPELLERDAE